VSGSKRDIRAWIMEELESKKRAATAHRVSGKPEEARCNNTPDIGKSKQRAATAHRSSKNRIIGKLLIRYPVLLFSAICWHA
jgi:hypothetical protein